ncbi:LPXTG cell wall anchor domain-containing protein [Actinoplanes sp. NPDC049599]|uniref:LPXTG cell wall anchor domain-containing protein n=1 Tax=Actinoplanes sp. NPDC049599 TaxID=3363903 RepID=UPI0037894985
MHRALHRLLAGTAAALLAAAAVALPGSPALAAGPSVTLHFPDTTVAGGLPKVVPLFAWVDVPDSPGAVPAPVAEVTVSVDTADVAGVATVTTYDEFELGDDQDCARTGTVITCTLAGPFEFEAGTSLVPLLVLEVTGKAGAAQDAHGELAFSARFGDAPAVTTEATVTIGEGVDLAGVISTPRTVAPGASIDTGLRVANAGSTAVRSAVLVVAGWDPSLFAGGGFSNCRYGFLTVCTFDDLLAADTTYELATPLRLKIPADAAAGSRASALGGWYTPGDFKELLDTAPELDEEFFGPKGTGGPVRLQPVPAKAAALRAAAGQVDTDPANNVMISEFVVGGSRRPDMAAVGATVTGDPGDKVDLRVGFVNNGPGTLYHWTFENTDPGTRVVVPAGVRAVTVDERCFPLLWEAVDPDDITEDVTGASEYLCMLEQGVTKAKASSLFDFTVQVRENPAAAAGKVVINDEFFVEDTPLDRDGSNDAAAITVALSGGEGGGLPVTGADAGLLGAGGAALLLAGAAGLLLVRRRRVRFTA